MKRFSWLVLIVILAAFLVSGCGGSGNDVADPPAVPEEPEVEVPAEVTAPDPVIGVIVGHNETDQGFTVSMLVDGNPIDLMVEEALYLLVVEDWDHYSHWGLYQAVFDADGYVISLEYGEGVEDIIGIFADYYAEKEMPDVISFADNTVTIISIEYLLDSDDPDDLPGFSTIINDNLTPAVGESFTISTDVIVYVEGEDGLFMNGNTSLISAPGYDFVEFYDVDGDLVYDIVIVWLV
ncbi:MAG: hypothetical protein U1E11_06690 [Dethiobacteria bacterium]|nr:hypothetical protein [Dethiobacteria bacterium]